jgi:pantothenate kinase
MLAGSCEFERRGRIGVSELEDRPFARGGGSGEGGGGVVGLLQSILRRADCFRAAIKLMGESGGRRESVGRRVEDGDDAAFSSE